MKEPSKIQIDLFDTSYLRGYKLCEHCNKKYFAGSFVLEQKYCSKNCKYKVREELYKGDKNPNYQGGGKECTCLNCSNIFRVPINMLKGGKHSGIYCSMICAREFKSNRKVPLNRIKVSKIFTRAILGHIKANRLNSKTKWLNHVDWTLKELKEHIEKLFVTGMTWENHGEWHLDHIKPKSYFNYESENDEEFRKCWSLSNLQPLWKEDNLSKGGRNTKINREEYGDIYTHYKHKSI